jgi:hypothetical protein
MSIFRRSITWWREYGWMVGVVIYYAAIVYCFYTIFGAIKEWIPEHVTITIVNP